MSHETKRMRKSLQLKQSAETLPLNDAVSARTKSPGGGRRATRAVSGVAARCDITEKQLRRVSSGASRRSEGRTLRPSAEFTDKPGASIIVSKDRRCKFSIIWDLSHN